MKFLNEKGIEVTQFQLFYRRNNISAKPNVPYEFCELVEDESFWPDKMSFRIWMGRTAWEKKQTVKRKAFEERRRAKYDREETEREERAPAENYGSTRNDNLLSKEG